MSEFISSISDIIGGSLSSSGSLLGQIAGFFIKGMLASKVGGFIEMLISRKTKYTTTRLVIFLVIAFLTVTIYGSIYQSFTTQESFFKKLGLERSMTTREIRKAYRNFAATNHPDKNPQTSRKQFAETTQIYNFMSDPDLRWNYDRFNIVADDNFIDFGEFCAQIFMILVSYFQFTFLAIAIFPPRKGIDDKSKC